MAVVLPLALGGRSVGTIVRIAFVHPHLQVGGAERQTVLLANRLVSDGHAVLVALGRDAGTLVSQLRPEVQTVVIGGHLAQQVTGIRRALGRWDADVVVSRLLSAHLVTFLALRGASLAKRHLAYEDLDPLNHFGEIRLGSLKRRVAGVVYRRTPHLAATTLENANAMRRVYGVSKTPHVIPPCVVVKQSTASLDSPKVRSARVVSVGSLTPRKNWSLAVDVMARIQETEWLLIGDGPLRGGLLSEARKHGAEITHIAEVSEPTEYIEPGDVLLHTSRTESFSLVIAEALSAGAHIVACSTTGAKYWRSHFPEHVTLCYSLDNFVIEVNSNLDKKQDIPDMSPWSLDEVTAKWLELFRRIARA